VSKTVNGVTRVYINNADWQEVAEYQGTAGFQPASGPRLKSRSGQGCPRSLAAGIQPALVQSYVFGTYIDEVLCMVKPDGQRYWYSTNDLYSVRALTDGTGTVVERYMFAPYGKVTVLDANGTPRTVNESLYGNPWTFTGRRLDQETGLIDFRSRMYSVDLGRFICRDPLEYVDGESMYGAYFVPDSLDPLGLATFGPITRKFRTDYMRWTWTKWKIKGGIRDTLFFEAHKGLQVLLLRDRLGAREVAKLKLHQALHDR